MEWKNYGKAFGESLESEQLSQLDSLARLLHVSLRSAELWVPVCAGYVLDDWHPQVGFVFEIPTAVSPAIAAPKTLYDGLGGSDVPFLGDRFKFAYELSLSQCLLHTAGWAPQRDSIRECALS